MRKSRKSLPSEHYLGKTYLMLKADLRKKYLAERRKLAPELISELSEKILLNFIAEFKPVSGQSAHIFLTAAKFQEPDTSAFINYFFENSIRVFVPKMVGADLLNIEIFPDNEFETNSWGITEPQGNQGSAFSNFDFVITPLLYCDEFGNRVGYGKGFYDRFFAGLRCSTKKIGVNFFPPLEEIDDVFPGDIPLDYLVTPGAVLSFGTGLSNSTK